MNFLQQIRNYLTPSRTQCSDTGIETAYDPMYSKHFTQGGRGRVRSPSATAQASSPRLRSLLQQCSDGHQQSRKHQGVPLRVRPAPLRILHFFTCLVSAQCWLCGGSQPYEPHDASYGSEVKLHIHYSACTGCERPVALHCYDGQGRWRRKSGCNFDQKTE